MTTPPAPADTTPWRKRFKERTTQAIAGLGQRRLGLSWNGIIIGGLGAALALWPLVATAWDLLGLTTGQAWRLGFLGAFALVLAAGVMGANWKRASPGRLVWLILTAWLVAAGAVAALTTLAWLALGTPDWQQLENLTPKHLDAIATRAFAIVAGLGGVALLVIAYRRQRTTEADAARADAANARAERAAEREVAKLFTDSFDSASDKLGNEHAAVRLAGVHALARLANEAPEGREDLVQMVIDVLCAYLRMPYTPRPGALSEQPVQAVLPSASPTTAVDLSRLRSTEHDDAQREKLQAAHEEHRRRVLEFASFRQVRHTIIRIIGNHLRDPSRWRGKNYDFTGTVFDGGDLSGAEFTGGKVSFSGAEFTGGKVYFHKAVFSGGEVSFNGARFTGGKASFRGAVFSGGKVSFVGARFTGGEVSFHKARFTGGRVSFSGAVFSGGKASFSGAEFSGGEVSFSGAVFSGGKASFHKARFTGATVDFHGTVFSGGEVSFSGAVFSGGKASFHKARFTGATVDFDRAVFSGATVSFRRARFTGGTADFNSASGERPGSLPTDAVRGDSGVVHLPKSWLFDPGHDSGKDGRSAPDGGAPNPEEP